MDYTLLQNLLDKISGCSFATIDATCFPRPGITLEITGERVIMFTNKNCSGYENKVRKGLIEAGKDPDSFVLGKLPWGQRVPDSPLIIHKDNLYLQTIVLAKGVERYLLNGVETPVETLKLPKQYVNPDPDKVVVHTYKIESLTRIALMGHVLVATDKLILPLSL